MRQTGETTCTFSRATGAAGLAVLLCLAPLAGCASSPGALFDPANTQHRWPPAPDQPRIQYVGELRGQADLHAGRSGLQRIGEALFGADPAEVFVSPIAVCTDGADRVFIADSNAQAVHVLDLRTRAYRKFASKEPQPRLAQPVALAWDPAGRLLVSDALGAEIVIFDAAGGRTGAIGTGILKRPCGLAIDPATHQVFVADTGAHQIVVFDKDGRELSRIGRRGSGPGEFNYPTYVTLDASGRLYVSDSLNFRVQIFSPNLEALRQIGRKGDMPGYFSQPKGIAIDPDGHLLVVDANFEAVQIFNAEGRLLMSFGHEGQAPGEFWLPAGIFVDPTGRIWIADSYNRRVQIFDRVDEGKQP